MSAVSNKYPHILQLKADRPASESCEFLSLSRVWIINHTDYNENVEQHDDNINYKQQDAKTNNVTENPEWEINWYLTYLFLNKSIFRKLPKLPGSLSLQLQDIDTSNHFFLHSLGLLHGPALEWITELRFVACIKVKR